MTFARGILGLLYKKTTGRRPKTPPKKSYSKCFRRTQIRWVIWRSSRGVIKNRVGRAPKYRTQGRSRYWRPKFTAMRCLTCCKNQCSCSRAVSAWVWTHLCVILWGWLKGRFVIVCVFPCFRMFGGSTAPRIWIKQHKCQCVVVPLFVPQVLEKSRTWE